MYVFAAGEYISILLVLHMLRQITGTLLYEIVALSLTRPGDMSVSYMTIVAWLVQI